MSTIEKLVTDNIDLWTSAIEKRATQGRGSNSKIKLYGIQKLRELILELAVRGLLVTQDPKDEPASVLLDKIKKEKERLVKVGKIRKQKVTSAIREDEKLFMLPDGWVWSRLAEISEANTGYAFKSSEYTETGTFVLRVTNINPDGSINLFDNKFIDPEIASTTYEKFSLTEGDVLLVMVGGSLGKIGIVSQECLPAVLNQNMWKLDRFGGIENKYFIAGIRFINENQITITKSTHGHLAQGAYMEKLFPLPPLAEQHRIVAKVDELMALCDQLEQQQTDSITAHQTLVETLLNGLVESAKSSGSNNKNTSEYFNHLIANHFDTLFTTEHSIDQLKQTILQLAVMGKLVPQDPNDEPASVLLEKISKEKTRLIEKGEIRKEKPLAEITEGEEPFELPGTWEWTKLEDIVNITSGITKGRKLAGRKLTTLPYLRVANVQRGFLDLATMKVIELPEDEVKKFTVVERDLLITEGGDWDKVGRTAVWRNELPLVAHQNHVFKARCISKEQNEIWLEKYLNSEVARDYFAGSSKQTTNLASINKTQLRRCFIAIPPINEQHRIVAKFSELMALCDTLKTRIAKNQTIQIHLADAIVEQAIG